MITNFKFQITPSKILYPEYPSIELYVRKKVTGFVWTDEEYTWSCLPGYTSENMGTVDVADYTSVGGKGYSFYLLSRPFGVFDKATNPCYGILSEIPKDFSIGATGSGSIHYGGSKVKHLSNDSIPDVLYADWKLLNVY